LKIHSDPAGDTSAATNSALRFDAFFKAASQFHGYPAPGVLLGCYMVEAAQNHIPEGVLYDAVCETPWCLPDAVQMLTPCTVGNGWLRILNLGLYALSLYDKYTGEGVRAYLDARKLIQWEDVADWILKRKPKPEQNSDRIRDQIRAAGDRMVSVAPVTIRPDFILKRSKGPIRICPLCHEAYPERDGDICRRCGGDAPYQERKDDAVAAGHEVGLTAIGLEQAVGHKLMHDMTQIIPGRSKGAAFKRGQTITAGDVCRLQQMGRNQVYVEGVSAETSSSVHEDEAAAAFGLAMAGDGTRPEEKPSEGKVNLRSTLDGLLVVDEPRLVRFNLVPDVMAASRKSYSIVKKNDVVAGTRAIPLYLAREHYRAALEVLGDRPLLTVRAVHPVDTGILITGTEIFKGLVQDRFESIIAEKVRAYGCRVVQTIIVPDDRDAIADAVGRLRQAGSRLIVTTAGLSVDPEDVTRKGLQDAGAVDLLYGAAVLPGAMTLLARIDDGNIIGVPACALYFKTTSFDLILPRILAGVPVSRTDLARLAHGGLCLNCRNCAYPKCRFGH
jgi:formylmethanofuran dehydrogenase subunit E